MFSGRLERDKRHGMDEMKIDLKCPTQQNKPVKVIKQNQTKTEPYRFLNLKTAKLKTEIYYNY